MNLYSENISTRNENRTLKKEEKIRISCNRVFLISGQIMHRRDTQATVWTTIYVRAIDSLRCRFVLIRILYVYACTFVDFIVALCKWCGHIRGFIVRRTQQFRLATFWRGRENCWEGNGFSRMKWSARRALSTGRMYVDTYYDSNAACTSRRNKLAIRKEERGKREKQKDKKKKRRRNAVCPIGIWTDDDRLCYS